MRMPGRNICRAFPELDRFTDEQCGRFLKAAKRPDVHRVFRWVACIVAGVAMLVGLMFVCTKLRQWLEGYVLNYELIYDSLGFFGVLIPATLACLFTLVLRDWLLRRHLAIMMRTRGACLRCGYGLLGLHVSEANTVICPECGYAIDVDPSLGELAVSDHGPAIFAPREHGGRATLLTHAQLRFLNTALRRGSIVLAVLIAMVLVFGVWRVVVSEMDAVRARKIYDFHGDYKRFARAKQPPGVTDADPNGSDLVRLGAAEFAAIATQVHWENVHRLAEPDPDGRSMVDLDFLVALPVAVDSAGADALRVKDWNLSIEVARITMERAAKAGLLTALDTLPQFARYEWQAPPDRPNYQDWSTLQLERDSLNIMAGVNAARLRAAVATGDHPEALRLLATTLALSRGMRMGAPNDATAMELQAAVVLGPLLRLADLDTLERVAWMLKQAPSPRYPEPPGRQGTATLHQQTAFYFSDPATTRWGFYSFYSRIWGLGPTPTIWLQSEPLGSLQDNIDISNVNYARLLQMRIQSPRDRAVLIVSPSPSADSLGIRFGTTGLFYSLEAIDELDLAYQGLQANLAIERFRLKHGQYPPTLDALVPEVLSSLPQEPWSPGPLHYIRLPRPDAWGRGYLLYSVGRDGIDSIVKGGGDTPLNVFLGRSAWMAPATGDHVLNPVDAVPVFRPSPAAAPQPLMPAASSGDTKEQGLPAK